MPAPSFATPAELKPAQVDIYAKLDQPVRQVHGGLKRESQLPFGPIAVAGLDFQMPATLLIRADVEVVKLMAVIIGNEPRHGLVIARAVIDQRLG